MVIDNDADPLLTERLIDRLRNGTWPVWLTLTVYLALVWVTVWMVVNETRVFRLRRRQAPWTRHREPDR